jgi:hypothetical protein
MSGAKPAWHEHRPAPGVLALIKGRRQAPLLLPTVLAERRDGLREQPRRFGGRSPIPCSTRVRASSHPYLYGLAASLQHGQASGLFNSADRPPPPTIIYLDDKIRSYCLDVKMLDGFF